MGKNDPNLGLVLNIPGPQSWIGVVWIIRVYFLEHDLILKMWGIYVKKNFWKKCFEYWVAGIGETLYFNVGVFIVYYIFMDINKIKKLNYEKDSKIN